MVDDIDPHKAEHGVESICSVLPIAPSTYYDHKAKQRQPEKRSAGVRQPRPWKACYDEHVLQRRVEPKQYVAIRYAERLADVGIASSVGSVGDSYDNALVETINGLYKTELIRQQGPWRGIEAVELATLTWVDWFNNRRIMESIGNVPPTELEAEYYQQQRSAMAA